MTEDYTLGFEHASLIIGFAALFIGFMIGSVCQRTARDDYWRRQAVMEGKAGYYTLNGAPEWRWKQ